MGKHLLLLLFLCSVEIFNDPVVIIRLSFPFLERNKTENVLDSSQHWNVDYSLSIRRNIFSRSIIYLFLTVLIV